MEMAGRQFNRLVFRMLAILALTVALMNITSGAWIVALILLSAFYGMSGNSVWFMVIYMTIPYMTMLAGELTGRGMVFSYGARIAVFSSTVLLMLQLRAAKTKRKIPIGGMFLYLACALVSSADGYCPPVSYLKILNYGVFMLGLYFGGRLITENNNDLLKMRAAIMAFAVFLVFGSVIAIAFPSISYMNAGSLISQGYSDREIALVLSSGGLNLFKGVANHSQTLASLLVVTVGWVICDMLFVAQKATRLHVSIILASIPLLYMTRSRTAFLGFATLAMFLTFYAVPKTRLPGRIKSRVKNALLAILSVAIVAAVALEIKDRGMTRWLRKTENLDDTRDFSEAFTASRMGLVEQNLYDFRRNVFLGSGFQVNEEIGIRYAASEGVTVSAPIEKGVLPLMVLGEGGILGAGAFLVFLAMFYGACAKNRYLATATLFTVYFMLNMSEATFFSANGGGFEWIVFLVGGFIVDAAMRRRRYDMSAHGLG